MEMGCSLTMWDVNPKISSIPFNSAQLFFNYVGCKSGWQISYKLNQRTLFFNYVGCKFDGTY